MSKSNPRILILSLSGIGNYLMQSPAIAALKKHWPDSRITVWVAPRGTKTLAENDPNVDEVIESPIKLPVLKHIRLVYLLARNRFDIGIMLSPGQLWKGAAYMFLAGIPKRIAHQYPFRNNPHSSFLLTDSVKEDPKLHDIDQNLNLLSVLKIVNCKLKIGAHYKLTVPPKNENKADSFLRSLALPSNAPLIGIHPGSAKGFEWKRWPLINFAALASLIQSNNIGLSPLMKGEPEGVDKVYFLIFGGPDESEQKNKLCKLIGPQAHAISSDLLTTAAVISKCHLFISNDSGLMHISAAVGTPTFGLFGPTDEKQTGPRGSKSWAVRAPGTKPVYKTENKSSLGNKPHLSMLAITPSYAQKIITSTSQDNHYEASPPRYTGQS